MLKTENIPLTSANDSVNEDFNEQKKAELKSKLKNQYREMIKTIDQIYDTEPHEMIVDIDDGIKHFDIDKIYCNCCGFSTLEQNVKKTTFFIFVFIINVVLLIQMSLLLTFYVQDRNKETETNSTSSSLFPTVD